MQQDHILDNLEIERNRSYRSDSAKLKLNESWSDNAKKFHEEDGIR